MNSGVLAGGENRVMEEFGLAWWVQTETLARNHQP
jgi:hypothetical protein